MKYALVSYSILSVLAGSIGCEQVEAPATPLTCSFALFNEQGQPTTVFTQGQNIVFQFQITNPTEQDVLLQNPPIETADFLVVTRQTSGEGVAALGKPYTNVFCTYQGGVPIPAHQILTLSIPWVQTPTLPTIGHFCGHAQTTYLPVGHYCTSFTTPLTILHGDQPNEVTPAKTFAVNFEVY